MAGNAHRNRHNKKHCKDGCIYCLVRPKYGNYKNKTGNRRNPARGKRQRKKRINII
jgi:hypothetical protein